MELFLIIASLIAGYVASVYSWPTIKIWANGLSAEAVSLRAKATQLENKIRGQ
jgi:hypothetical protein